MINRLLLTAVLITLCTDPLHADQVTAFAINTSSIAGTQGSIDFQFNPGPLGSQAATVQILNFSGGGYAGSQVKTGAASGGPVGNAPLILSNATSYNDDFESFNFGNFVFFVLDFSGPAVNSPDHVSASGSSFAFSMFSNRAGTQPALTPDPTGFAGVVNLNLNGSVTALTISPELQIVPEPASFFLAAAFLVAISVTRLRRKSIAG